jgi:hypothetical protein
VTCSREADVGFVLYSRAIHKTVVVVVDWQDENGTHCG